MPTLVEMALDSLEGDCPEDGITLAASFFEASLGRRVGLDRAEVLAEPATAAELSRLRDRLIALARAEAPVDAAGAAVWALGKLRDPGLGPFFVDVLRRHLRRDAGVLYQAMIAMDDLGAGVFAVRDSMSAAGAEENRAIAAAFLRRPELGSV